MHPRRSRAPPRSLRRGLHKEDAGATGPDVEDLEDHWHITCSCYVGLLTFAWKAYQATSSAVVFNLGGQLPRGYQATSSAGVNAVGSGFPSVYHATSFAYAFTVGGFLPPACRAAAWNCCGRR